jgi:nitrite reductase/ring-hydroxylating ferredoxin subunit
LFKYDGMTADEVGGVAARTVSRRGVLGGAAVVGVVGVAGASLVACGGMGGGGDTGGAASGGPTTVPAAQVPVGGAAIVGQFVVSQPAAGSYKAFSAVCTHQGCLISEVRGATVVCPCHQSSFKATDGSVLGGPARRALDPKTVSVSGDNLTLS